MKKQLTIIGLFLLAVSVSLVSGDDAALTNEDIVSLIRAGLGAEVIIAKIKTSATKFDTSVEELLALKDAGVEDDVIAAMVNAGGAAPATADVDTDLEESFIVTYPAQETAPTGGATQTTPAAPAVSAPAMPAPGSSFRDRLSSVGEGPEMVVIPAGRFRMVDLPDAGFDVVIARPFALSKYEITFEDYDKFTYPNKVDDEGWGRRQRPVINVSWDDANEYAAWLSAQTGKRYRLPTEAEWEHAARAGSTTEYSWGNGIGQNRANCINDLCGDRWEYTAPVGSFSANAFGLYDMHGNVWEWVQDCWNDSYAGAPGDGSAWTSGDCSQRVIRGGSWLGIPWEVRSGHRRGDSRTDRVFFNGFRLAQDL